jgi:hypothetical protein
MFPQFPATYITDGDGDVPPEYGGTLACKRTNFTFASTTGATVLTLPAGATIVDMTVVINTVFSGGTTTLSVGHTGSATYYLSAASVLGTAGPTFSTAWLTSGKWNTKLSSPEPITITVGASNTAGSGWLIVRYTME